MSNNVKYTDEELLEILRNAILINPNISKRQFNLNKSYPHSTVYQKRFGSWNNAKILVGANINKHEYSDEELLEILKAEFDKNPDLSVDEFNKNPNTPSLTPYNIRFGGWNNAKKLIGVNCIEYKTYSNEELLNILKDYNSKYGFPSWDNRFAKNNNLPYREMYDRRFGSWINALNLAGIEIPKNKKKTFGSKNNNYSLSEIKNELKILIKLYLEDNVKLPSINTIVKSSEFLSSVLLYKTFGTTENMYKEIGYDYIKFNEKKIKEDMINKYFEIKEILGYSPNSRELDKFSYNNNYYYNTSTYTKYFENLKNFYNTINDTSNLNIGRMLSNEEILDNLYKLKEEIGFIPTKVEINKCSYLPYVQSILYRLNYKSLVDLQNDLFGETSSHVVRITTINGTKCFSSYEYIVAQILENGNYCFIKDGYYKDFIKQLSSKHTTDFIIWNNNNYYFIEIFGLMSYLEYAEKTTWKIQLCKDNNIPLLALYPKDISMSQFDELSDTIRKFVEN